MRKALLAAVAAAVMACSCTTIAPPSVSAIGRTQAAYDRIATSAEVVMPVVSPERAARIRLATSLTERVLLAARNATKAAEKLAALKRAEVATAAIEVAAAPSP